MKNLLITLAVLLVLGSPLSAQMISNNKVLSWTTSAGQSGKLQIVSVNGQYFEAIQTNDKNQAAGAIKLYGAIVDGGAKIILINISQWKEVWEGTVSARQINGKLTAGASSYTFQITEQVARHVAPAPFVNGKTYTWSTNAGQNGTIFVTSVTGSKFTFDQVNFNNRGAGTTKLDGEFKDGKIYIYNREWNETWTGSVSGKIVTGTINNRYTFTINLTTEQVERHVAPAPFVKGKTYAWSTNAGQNGTILVTSVTGSKFTLNQVNFKNRGAGTITLDGEFKDGKIYIYNRKWNETWTGSVSGNNVTGTINSRYSFTINLN